MKIKEKSFYILGIAITLYIQFHNVCICDLCFNIKNCDLAYEKKTAINHTEIRKCFIILTKQTKTTQGDHSH